MLAILMLVLTTYTERKMQKAILDVTTGEMTFVPLSAEEIAEREKIAQEQAEKLKERQQAEAEAAAAKAALLDKLGITEDEARLLLGGN